MSRSVLLTTASVILALILAAMAGTAVAQTSADNDLPTSKEQCKKGGWKEFPALGFKNQRECVSYVGRVEVTATGNIEFIDTGFDPCPITVYTEFYDQGLYEIRDQESGTRYALIGRGDLNLTDYEAFPFGPQVLPVTIYGTLVPGYEEPQSPFPGIVCPPLVEVYQVTTAE